VTVATPHGEIFSPVILEYLLARPLLLSCLCLSAKHASKREYQCCVYEHELEKMTAMPTCNVLQMKGVNDTLEQILISRFLLSTLHYWKPGGCANESHDDLWLLWFVVC